MAGLKRIASRDNPVFKSLRARRDRSVATIEGVHLCAAFLDAGGSPRRAAVGASSVDDREVRALLARIGAVDAYALDDALYASLSDIGDGPAILLEIDVPRVDPPARVAATSVFLDRVQDPGNVGSLLRSAAAAGIRDVYASVGCAGLWSPKVLRAGMGAHFVQRLFVDADLVALAAACDVPRIATSSHASDALWDVDLRGACIWMFGHEGRGLDPALEVGARRVAIPQPGTAESLNVAAAAAVCFFEQTRQQRSA